MARDQIGLAEYPQAARHAQLVDHRVEYKQRVMRTRCQQVQIIAELNGRSEQGRDRGLTVTHLVAVRQRLYRGFHRIGQTSRAVALGDGGNASDLMQFDDALLQQQFVVFAFQRLVDMVANPRQTQVQLGPQPVQAIAGILSGRFHHGIHAAAPVNTSGTSPSPAPAARCSDSANQGCPSRTNPPSRYGATVAEAFSMALIR